MTFAEKFCAQRGIHPEKFEEHVFRLSLRPAARRLRYLLALIRGYFEADRELIRGAGRATRLVEIEGELLDFAHDPNNRGFLRRRLNLRVSRRRLHALARETLRDGGAAAAPGGTVAVDSTITESRVVPPRP